MKITVLTDIDYRDVVISDVYFDEVLRLSVSHSDSADGYRLLSQGIIEALGHEIEWN